jgi:hypothetical protein
MHPKELSLKDGKLQIEDVQGPTVDTDFVFKYKGERVLMKYEENNKIEC